MDSTHPLADDEPNRHTTLGPDRPTLESGQERTSSFAAEIGVEIEDQTHYGHVRYAAGDEDDVIWYDQRDGRGSFSGVLA